MPTIPGAAAAAARSRHEDDEFLRACGEQGVAFVPFFAIAAGWREAGADSDEVLAIPGPLWEEAACAATSPRRRGALPAAGRAHHLVAGWVAV